MPDRIVFAQGQLTYLRPLENEDLGEKYLGWLNDPEVTKYMETGVFPTTRVDLEKFYQEVTGSRSQVILAVVNKESHEHIGNVKLGPIHWVHRNAVFGLLIGDKRFWGRGYGIEVTRLAVEYGFYKLNLHRIGLGVFAEHKAAVRCYERVGFKIEGCMREDLFRGGEYRDRLWMGLLSSEYKATPSRKRG